MGLWVNKRVIVDNFRKATLFNTFLDDKLKVIFVGVGGPRNPTSAIWASFRCSMIRTKWRFWIFLAMLALWISEIDESLVLKAIRDWYVDSEDEQDTLSECDSDCEWEWVFCEYKNLCSFLFSYFSRKSFEVWGKWDYRFDIQLLRKNQNRQKFLWW